LTYTYLDCLAYLGVGGAHPGGLQLTKNILLAVEKIDDTTSVLDVGCGTGQTSAYIAENYRCYVTSLDSNKIMLDKAKQRFSSLQIPIEVKQGNTENLPFDNASFDVILSESVITFTDISKTIPEFIRVLKSSGVLLAIEMVLEKGISADENKQIVDFYGFSQLLTESEWYELFKRAGFRSISVEKYNPEFSDINIQNAADFSISENIDDTLLEILEKHEELTEIYKDKLGFRIFRCYV